MISHILVNVTAFLLISIAPWQSWFDHTGDKKIPPPDVEKELMMEVWRVYLQNEEKGGLLFLLHLSFDYKTVSSWGNILLLTCL